jgi:hypothetical protein
MSQEKKAIVTAAGPNMMPLLENYALPTFERFADEHGYSVCVKKLENDDRDRNGTQARTARWMKFSLLRNALSDYSIAVWLDADVMIRRTDEDVADNLHPDGFQALSLEQVPSEKRTNPNTGVWVMRSCQKAFDFLDAAEAAGEQPGKWMDQAAVMKALDWEMGEDHDYRWARPGRGNDYMQGTTWLPTGWNQPYLERSNNREACEGRAIVAEPHAIHYMGMHIEERAVAMDAMYQQIFSRGNTTVSAAV